MPKIEISAFKMCLVIVANRSNLQMQRHVTFVSDSKSTGHIYFHQEVILEEDQTNDRKEIHKYNCKNSSH